MEEEEEEEEEETTFLRKETNHPKTQNTPKLPVQVGLFEPIVLIVQVLRCFVVQIRAIDSQRIEIGDVVTALLISADNRLDGKMILHLLQMVGGRSHRRRDPRHWLQTTCKETGQVGKEIKTTEGNKDVIFSSSFSCQISH